jgi:hypothetical protein
MRRRRLPVLALTLAGLPGLASAQEEMPSAEHFGLRLEYREFRPTFTGDVRKSSGAEAGTLIDIVSDLGIEDERTFEARGTIQFRLGHRLRGSYTPLSYDGDVDEVRRNFRYGDTEFQRFDRVRTTIRGGYYSGAYEWDFLRGPRGYLGALVGAKVFDIDSILVNVDNNEREQDTTRAPIPVLGVVTRVYAGRLSLEGEFSGLTIGKRGSLWEFDTSLRLHLSDRLAAQGGYRRLSLRAEDGGDEGDMLLSGWTFGLEFSL